MTITRNGVKKLANTVKTFGIIVGMLAALANTIIGFVVLIQFFGCLALIGILVFPVVTGLYPFIVWIFEGETGYLLIWGILWGAFILGGVIASIGAHFSGEDL